MKKDSIVWTMSTEKLEAHLAGLTAPDQVYWDARELKTQGKKFQKMDWGSFKKPTKVNGQWVFQGEQTAQAAPSTPLLAAQAAPSTPLLPLKVADRIDYSGTTPAIKLDGEERTVYSAAGGCGWKLARFENVRLVELFDPTDEMRDYDDSETDVMVGEALLAAGAWLEDAKGEAYLVMCSCYLLCDVIPCRRGGDRETLTMLTKAFRENLEIQF